MNKKDGKQKTTTFAWITDLPVNGKTVERIATHGGRIRSKIENEGFNIQKNSGLNLEHPYSHDEENAKSYYFLLQIAHLIQQLIEKGSLLRHLAAQSLRHAPPAASETASEVTSRVLCSLEAIAENMLNGLRFFRLPDAAFDAAEAGRIQIRLNNST